MWVWRAVGRSTCTACGGGALCSRSHVTLLRVLLRVDLLLRLLRFGVHLVPVALEVDARVVRHL